LIKETAADPQDYFEKSLAEKKETMGSKGFQREPNPARAREIAKFLDNEEYPFFPNSIVGIDLISNNIILRTQGKIICNSTGQIILQDSKQIKTTGQNKNMIAKNT